MKVLHDLVDTKSVRGQLSLIEHKGGEFINGKLVGGEIIHEETIQNLIVDTASQLMAARMAPGAITGATDPAFQGNFVDKGLQYLAVGVGVLQDPSLPYDEVTNNVDRTQWDLQNPPSETLTTTKLVGEFYRKRFTSWCFLDAAGNETSSLTNVLKITTTFLENEANGPITEIGLYGGDAQAWNAGAGKDSGYLFNYKTVKVWNKIDESRLTIVWKLTF
jgi:hypothetical protein